MTDVTDVTEPEYRLLNALSDTTQYSLVELVESSGVRRDQVGRLLAHLVRDGYVLKQRQGRRAEYRLSPAGVGRRTMARGLAKDGPVGVSDYLKAVSTARQHAGIAATRERLAATPLTDQERSICEASLTTQHQQIRFDWTDLTRRRALLAAAVTHGQLLEVFDGLEMPPLYADHPAAPGPAQRRPTGSSRRAAWLLVCLIIFLLGIELAKDAANPGDYVGAAIFVSVAIVFAYPALGPLFTMLQSIRRKKPPR